MKGYLQSHLFELIKNEVNQNPPRKCSKSTHIIIGVYRSNYRLIQGDTNTMFCLLILSQGCIILTARYFHYFIVNICSSPFKFIGGFHFSSLQISLLTNGNFLLSSSNTSYFEKTSFFFSVSRIASCGLIHYNSIRNFKKF